MRRPQITRVQGGQIDINAPNAQTHYVDEDIHLYRRQIIHHHHEEAEHRYYGEPTPVEIDMDPTQVRVHVTGPQTQYIHGRREQDRGALRPADQRQGQQRPQFTALPAPSRQQAAPKFTALPAGRGQAQALSLPPPRGQSQGQKPMQLTDQRPIQNHGFWSSLFSAPPQKVKR
jgi:hypothetical protein